MSICCIYTVGFLCLQNGMDSKETVTGCLVFFLVLKMIPLADITHLFVCHEVLYKKEKRKKSELALKKIKKQIKKTPPPITKALCLILPLNK